jgi:WD40 repeat protein
LRRLHFIEPLHVCSTNSQFTSSLFLLRLNYVFIFAFDARSRHALQKKFRIVMSTFAYGILTTFLIHNNLLLLAAMVNDKIHIEKVQDWPGSQSLMFEFDADSSEVGIVGLVGGAGRGPLAPVRLWAPSKGMSSLETKDDPLYREWISKLAHPRAKLADWASKRATDIHFRDDSTGGEATAKRVKMSSEATRLAALDKAKILEPNVIFATITNTHDDMSCLHINRTMTQAAAGFKDSCVRVWKLNENDNKGFGTSLSTGSGNNVSGAGGSSWAMREVLPITKGAGPVLLPAGASDASSLMRPMLELRGHRKPVYAVSQDDSGRIVLSGSADNTVRLWDTSVAQCVGKFECMSPVWGVSLSPLRYYFAAACHDSTALVFSTDRVAPIRLLAGHRSDVTAVTWHESGSLLGTCSDDKQVRLWDMRAGKCVRLFEGSHAPLCSIALTSFALGNTASSMIAAGSDTGMVHLWDVGTSRKLAVCQGHEGPVHTVSFSKDGGALISGGADCSMKIFDTSMAFAPALRAVIASDYTSSSVLNREATPIIKPHKTFHTKFSPVYFADATPYGMVYSGGPFSLPSALGT